MKRHNEQRRSKRSQPDPRLLQGFDQPIDYRAAIDVIRRQMYDRALRRMTDNLAEKFRAFVQKQFRTGQPLNGDQLLKFWNSLRGGEAWFSRSFPAESLEAMVRVLEAVHKRQSRQSTAGPRSKKQPLSPGRSGKS